MCESPIMSTRLLQWFLLKFRLEQANLYYAAATGLENDLHFKALQYPRLGMPQYLISQMGFPWDADFINLKASLVTFTQMWPDVSSSTEPCPISFTPEEQKQALDDAEEWNESADMLSTVRDAMGIDLEGGTEPENYEFARNMNLGFRMEMVRQAEEHEREIAWRAWPYKECHLLQRSLTNSMRKCVSLYRLMNMSGSYFSALYDCHARTIFWGLLTIFEAVSSISDIPRPQYDPFCVSAVVLRNRAIQLLPFDSVTRA